MITHKLLTEDAIAVVEPSGPLSEQDFKELSKSVDDYLAAHPFMKGLLIHTRQFPGWEDFSGLIHHIQFVRNHHRKIRKVALVTDSKLATAAPRLAAHFVSAEVRSFEYNAYDAALAWLCSDAN
ncbi:MAG: STAS/SEC14 domain-containing protein [Akkermansiaceae bacterium]|nr:STAS/SEC14 domain-containing protein [Akkermansiaceae bacterium]